MSNPYPNTLALSSRVLRVLTQLNLLMLGICVVQVAHFVLTPLRMIVETVSTGNPFVAANAARLQSIAGALLALELTHFAAGIQ